MLLRQFILRNKIRKSLPKRKRDSNKGDFGRVLIVGGSSGMTGAAVLASRGALRSGAGLTYIAVPKELVNVVDSQTPEVITLPFEKIKSIKANVVAVGPGLGIGSQAKKIITSLITHSSLLTPLVLDADALNILAKNPNLLKKAKAEVVITPHPGEMARLLKMKIKDIQKDRKAAAIKAAKKFKCIVVLKGYKTVIANRFGKTVINPTGNDGMASGGVGDVLTGIIAGLIGQGMNLFDAAVAGVYIHGAAGDLAAKDKGRRSMIASDLVEKIPYAL
jgi:ADP-dependent NAD(P)H-hydrate dehydratase / NAD(P)H-hydrate epimerase